MSTSKQLMLSGNRGGRILLHVLTIRRNRRYYRRALAGIGREIGGALNDAASTALECLATLEGEL